MENTPTIKSPLTRLLAKLNALIEYLANPTRFMRFSRKILPWLIAASAIALTYGLYLSWFKAPYDYQQGHTVKIMFIHVPMASLGDDGLCADRCSLYWQFDLAPSIGGCGGQGSLADWRGVYLSGSGHRLAMGQTHVGHLLGVGCAPHQHAGLFFLYLGLMAIWEAIDDHSRAGRAAAILAVVGAINLPIIKFSVNWWNTLHQPASIKPNIAIHSSILTPLLVMWLGFTLLFIVLHLKAMRAEVLRRKVEAMQLRRVERANR